ncbi:hypothetical protein Hanom_Chr12g01130521 [Helianthus anomalus]
MVMARDGLIPSFFSEVDMHTQVRLAGMADWYPSCIHNGANLCSDTSVRPSDEVPFPSSLQAAIDSVSLRYSNVIRTNETDVKVNDGRTMPFVCSSENACPSKMYKFYRWNCYS